MVATTPPAPPGHPDTLNPRQASWSRFWQSGALHSMDASVGPGFSGAWADFWHQAFAGTSPSDRVLDIGTGNGGLPQLMLVQLGDKSPNCDAIDLAQVQPTWWQQATAAWRQKVVFHGHTRAESLPFEDARFQHVFSQFGFEYTEMQHSVPELLRVLTATGTVHMVAHHRDSKLAEVALDEQRHIDALLKADGLLPVALAMMEPLARARTAQGRAELSRDAAANALRDRFNSAQDALTQAMALTAHPDVLQETRDRVARAVMLATQDGVEPAQALLLAWQTDLQDSALRLGELLHHALDAAGAQQLCARLSAKGGQAHATPLHHQQMLVAWQVRLTR